MPERVAKCSMDISNLNVKYLFMSNLKYRAKAMLLTSRQSCSLLQSEYHYFFDGTLTFMLDAYQ